MNTGNASRAASITAVTFVAWAASGPPTVATMMPSAAVTMLNSRTRSARARPASASRMCSASATRPLELMKPLTRALDPAVRDHLAQLADQGRMRRDDQRDDDGDQAAALVTERCDGGEHGADALRARPGRRRSGRRARPPTGLSTRMMVSRSATEPEVRSVPMPGTAMTSAGASWDRLTERPAGGGRRAAATADGSSGGAAGTSGLRGSPGRSNPAGRSSPAGQSRH